MPKVTGPRYQWVRWSVLAMTLLTSVALIATAFSSFMTVRRASQTVVRGQGEAIVRHLLRALLELRRPATQEDLNAVLAELSDSGLRYVALFDIAGKLVLDAGDRTSPPAQLEHEFARASPGTVAEVAGLIRMFQKPPPDFLDSVETRADEDLFPPRLPLAAIEFRPLVAQQLRVEAAIALGVGLIGAALLVVGALVVWRLILRTEAAAERSEHEQRLAALGTMSAVLAHEIRNPLASLKGHAQLLAERTAQEETPLRGMAERVVSDTLRLESLTTNLLDFARTGQIARSITDPVELVRRACEECSASRFALNLESAPAHWPLDPAKMHRVLVNVFRNALQASPSEMPIEVAVSSQESQLIIEIRDHGEGIPHEMSDQLFEPFATTRIRGAGLGLAIAKRIVSLHGGAIEADDHPEGGAVFRIKIPHREGV